MALLSFLPAPLQGLLAGSTTSTSTSTGSTINALGPIFAVLLLVYLLCWTVYTRFFHPLSGIPGPFWASITRFWYVKSVRKGKCDVTSRELHRKYGHLVRVAPDEVSVSDPAAMRVIYGVNNGFTKTDFYLSFRSDIFKTKDPDNFSNQNEITHSQSRKYINPTFSMPSVLTGEEYIDSCTSLILERLSEYAKSETILDLGEWLQWYTFDVIGELFFGAKLGFMETKSDVNGYIACLDTFIPIISIAGIIPQAVRGIYFLSGILFPSIRNAIFSFGNIEKAADTTVDARKALFKSGEEYKGRNDLLAKLFAVHLQKGDEYNPQDIKRDVHGAFFAGSDTTSIAMVSIVYNIIIHPRVYETLLKEIDEAIAEGKASMPISYAQAIKLPYFQACCKEGMRMHPSVAMSLPRVVPKGGCTISGRYFPAGSKVGINAAVLHYDESVFGKDADEFRPERWLGPDAANMERHMLHFGAGSRICVGKYVSLAEINKLIPSLLYQYRIELAYPGRPLEMSGYWFNKQTGFHARVQKRTKH